MAIAGMLSGYFLGLGMLISALHCTALSLPDSGLLLQLPVDYQAAPGLPKVARAPDLLRRLAHFLNLKHAPYLSPHLKSYSRTTAVDGDCDFGIFSRARRIPGTQNLVELVVSEEFGSGCLVDFMVTATNQFGKRLHVSSQPLTLRIELDGQAVLEQNAVLSNHNPRLQGIPDRFTYTIRASHWGFAAFWPGLCFSTRARISFIMHESLLHYKQPPKNVSEGGGVMDEALRFYLDGVEEAHNECSLRFIPGRSLRHGCKNAPWVKLTSNKDVAETPPTCGRPGPPAPAGVYSINIYAMQGDIHKLPTMGPLAADGSPAYALPGSDAEGASQGGHDQGASNAADGNADVGAGGAEDGAVEPRSTEALTQATSPFAHPLVGPSSEFKIPRGQRVLVWGHGNREEGGNPEGSAQGAGRGGTLTALVLKPADQASSVGAKQLHSSLWLIAEWDEACPACPAHKRHGKKGASSSVTCDSEGGAAERGSEGAGRRAAQVEAPVWGIFHFHAMGPYPQPPPLLSSAFGSTKDDEWYLLWPMPFQYCVRLYLEYRDVPPAVTDDPAAEGQGGVAASSSLGDGAATPSAMEAVTMFVSIYGELDGAPSAQASHKPAEQGDENEAGTEEGGGSAGVASSGREAGALPGHFYARWKQQCYEKGFGNNVLVDVTGASGHVVALKMHTLGNAMVVCESDIAIDVDGSGTPAMWFTGMEDAFNGFHKYRSGDYSGPTFGWQNVATGPGMCSPNGEKREVSEDAPEMNQYRIFATDRVSFRKSLQIRLEGIGYTPDAINYTGWAALVMYYAREGEERMRLSDEVQVGDEGSEAAHKYSFPGSQLVLLNSSYPAWRAEGCRAGCGDSDWRHYILSDVGRITTVASLKELSGGNGANAPSEVDSATTSVSFCASISGDNNGVLLRRRIDSTVMPQLGLVSVNGEEVGYWMANQVSFEELGNRYSDAEFTLPKQFTANKDRICVSINVLAPEGFYDQWMHQSLAGAGWTEFHYWIFSLF